VVGRVFLMSYTLEPPRFGVVERFLPPKAEELPIRFFYRCQKAPDGLLPDAYLITAVGVYDDTLDRAVVSDFQGAFTQRDFDAALSKAALILMNCDYARDAIRADIERRVREGVS
jgi:hypothetical protein